MKSKIDQYAKTTLKYDESLLDDRQKVVVKKLYEAAKIIDDIFLDQVYSKNKDILKKLSNSDDELDKLKLEFFKINFGLNISPFFTLIPILPIFYRIPCAYGINIFWVIGFLNIFA